MEIIIVDNFLLFLDLKKIYLESFYSQIQILLVKINNWIVILHVFIRCEK